MKSLAKFIQEKLIIKKNKHNYFPQTREELQDIILKRIKEEGNEVDLNDIDVSKITNMQFLFSNLNCNCDISSWDVSNVKDMSYTFSGCSKFNQDISWWDVSNVTTMDSIFCDCVAFNQNISKWDVSKVTNNYNMFDDCPIQDKYKPKFK